MNGFATSRLSFSQEEKLHLIDGDLLPDVETEDVRAGLKPGFSTQPWMSNAGLYCKFLRLSSWAPMLKRTGIFLLPSFIQQRIGYERARSDRLGPTAYLDGMRGLAALFVFFCHYFYTSFRIAEGWGHNNENYDFWKLPFVRLLFSGPSMVCLFFVISGYALSLKPMKQARSHQFDGFANTMASFVFRRGFRLFLPTGISTFMVICLVQLGVYENTHEFAHDRQFMKNVIEVHPERTETFSEQLSYWYWDMWNFIHVWGWEKFGGSTGYDVHLWTIPVEYRASMMLFLVIIGLARLRTGVRFVCLAGIAYFSYRWDRWEMVLFLAGLFLAELDIIRGAHNPPQTSAAAVSPILPLDEKPVPTVQRDWMVYVCAALSVVAMYFMSEPDLGPDGVPGWETLGSLIPDWFEDKYRFWQIIGGIIFVFCVARVPQWQRFFNLPFVQYFGRISYALYLMHGPVTHTAGFMIQRWAWSITGTEGFNYNWGAILAALFNIPLVIWAGDIFWRAIDAPSVKFARWLETKCTIRS